MAEVAAHKGYALAAPSSRQDIISALLSDYGNSFGHDIGSCSPVPADKDLPPPPPRSDSLRNKPLPAFERAEQRMSMKFQLREDALPSPSSISKDASGRSRKKILYRSLSRDGKPPSLNLVISNGSTAIVPPTPALSARTQTYPVDYAAKDLPSPPPPPPKKSERRSTVQKPAAGPQQSRPRTELARNDSLLSPNKNKVVLPERPATVESTNVVKRKAVAVMGAKKFISLAQLGSGPRGGKGGPLPPVSIPRKTTTNSQEPSSSKEEGPRERVGEVVNERRQNQPELNQLPPTPEEDKVNTAAPAPPRKAVAALGLPSNPRRGGPISPKHVRGKSSTGFNLLKAQRPAPRPPMMKVEALTPEMTPSPTLKPEMPKEQMSPVSPLPPAVNEQTRPFSFEPLTVPKPSIQTQSRTQTPNPITPSIPVPTVEKALPIRPTSLDTLDPSPAFHPDSNPSPGSIYEPEPPLPESTPELAPAPKQPTPLPPQRKQQSSFPQTTTQRPHHHPSPP
ncbi:hypothetical protein GQ44DRAFT_491189 [Phaeosphaeriaceae sp. PMI808]|nr:hypothetical protein GQ44DRAFT_491189 [Phaeosphaeriaceae sp. PMI808]